MFVVLSVVSLLNPVVCLAGDIHSLGTVIMVLAFVNILACGVPMRRSVDVLLSSYFVLQL